MKIERILVPTDFTRGSHAVLKRAIDVAREHDSEIVLVHVIEPLPYGVGRWTEPTQTLEHYAEAARTQLDRFTDAALGIYPKCTSELHFGILHEIVSELARKLSVDLIVVAAPSQSRYLEKIRRSVAEKLVRQAACPVLAVHADGGVDQEDHVSASP